jgi:drug/metabolite transporter (DMT)-like permease
MTGALWQLSPDWLRPVPGGELARCARHGCDFATFLQLFVSAIVLAAITLFTEDLTLVRTAPPDALINFALAGFFHFFIGWTFLNASQKAIGAARTSSLIATTPLWAAILAAFTLSEIPTVFTVSGVLIIFSGVYVVNNPRQQVAVASVVTAATADGPTASITAGPVAAAPRAEIQTGMRPLLMGLAAAICWSISPIFIRQGLETLDSTIIGVTVGVVASVLGYAVVLAVRHMRAPVTFGGADALTFKIIAGVLVGLSTWVRWVALDLTTVAAVLALSLVSVPVVNIVSPLFVGQHVENINLQVWIGSLIIIGGALILILT